MMRCIPAHPAAGWHRLRSTTLLAAVLVSWFTYESPQVFGQVSVCWARLYLDHLNQRESAQMKAIAAEAKHAEGQLKLSIERTQSIISRDQQELSKAVEERDLLASSTARINLQIQNLRQRREKQFRKLIASESGAAYRTAVQEINQATVDCTTESQRVLGRPVSDGRPGKIRGSRRAQDAVLLNSDSKWKGASTQLVRAQDSATKEMQRLIANDSLIRQLDDSLKQSQDERKAMERNLSRARRRVSSLKNKLQTTTDELEEAQLNMQYIQKIIALNDRK